jgi:uncharacterized protein
MIALVLSTFAMGLFGGVHCATMCGGVASVVCANASGTRHAIAFNAGRITAYSALGVAAGAMGALPSGPYLDVLKLVFRATAVIATLTVGLHLVGLPSFVRALEAAGGPLWKRISPYAARLLPLRSTWHALFAGALWAFMPCGLLYAALAVAATAGSFSHGALTMAAFGLGTLPTMASVALAARHIVRVFARRWLRRVAGSVLLACGLWSFAGLARPMLRAERSVHACCPHR